MEFEEYRSYELGDDFRKVDPAVFLRTGQYQVKRYSVERALDVLVVLDMSESMDSGSPNKLKLARQIAASIAYVALAGGDRVRAVVLGPEPEWSRQVQGRSSFSQLSTWLRLRNSPGGVIDSSRLEKVLTSQSARGSLIFLVSDCLIPGIEQVLHRLRAADLDVVLHQVMSPEELDPGLLGPGRIDLLDCETGDVVECDLGDETLERYRAELDALNTAIERSLVSPDRYFLARSDDTIEQVVLGNWRSRELIS